MHFGSRWLSEMVRSCVNTWEILKLFKQILSCSRSKNLCDSISKGAFKLPSYHFLMFGWFRVDNADIVIVMQHACKRAWSIYSNGSGTEPEEILARIDYLQTEIFEYEFQYIFLMVYDTPAMQLWYEIWKCPNLNQKGLFNISSWCKPSLHAVFNSRWQ